MQKIGFFITLLLLSSCAGVQRVPTPVLRYDVRILAAEGTVRHVGGGGTRETYYPEGYILDNYIWIGERPDPYDDRVYLRGIVDDSYLGKSVRAIGKTSRKSTGGLIPAGYWVMDVDTLTIVN